MCESRSSAAAFNAPVLKDFFIDAVSAADTVPVVIALVVTGARENRGVVAA
jgi:hypothetical protein